MLDPIRMSFDVDCPVEHAFNVWTAKTSSWWPVAHTMSAEPGLEVVFEGRVGGRIFERTTAGVEMEWGHITVWEPPRRLGYLWRIATEESNATEVEIHFVDCGDATTRVDIEHRGWEMLGDFGQPWRETNLGGWEGVMPEYLAACVSG
jgi:hypothetical protein